MLLHNKTADSVDQKILSAVQTVLGQDKNTIALHQPEFSGNEWKYVKNCLDVGWVSSVGAYVDQFENDLCDYTGAKFAIATVNGTAALHLALMLAGVKATDEVIVPTLSFVATANAISYCAATPHFVDVSDKTLGLDPKRLYDYLNEISEQTGHGLKNKLTGHRIAAIVPMHTYGHPVEIDALLEISERFKIPLVEDAAESLGSKYKNRHCGTFGLVAALSFNGNKIITTGGGGALLTNNKKIAEKAKHLSTTAKQPHPWSYIHDAVGYNYRLPNINAALGCAQLESLETWISEKRALAEKFKLAFNNCPEIKFFAEPENCRSNYWLNAIILDENSRDYRNKILKSLNTANYMSRPAWCLLHKLIPYRGSPRMEEMRSAEKIELSLINVPSSPFLVRRM